MRLTHRCARDHTNSVCRVLINELSMLKLQPLRAEEYEGETQQLGVCMFACVHEALRHSERKRWVCD